ncbi:MAG: aldehyde dehydrogenase family protein [Planctomycetes bacterium]|nr:aldehyde dehydrogenase family protein [Planctomycetota bacterium]
MSTTTAPSKVREWPCYIAGKPLTTGRWLDVHYPYNGELAGRVAMAGRADLEAAIAGTHLPKEPLTRYRRYEILETARRLLGERTEQFANLIRSESGLCIRETRYEVGRAQDVLQFAAIESLKDDGQIFSCDISPQGKARKIFTLREPLQLVAAITPFNHPLNQVAHKVAPAVAAGAPMILKPSHKTPLSAIAFVELLYEAGLPQHLLSVIIGPRDEVTTPLVQHDKVELVTITSSVNAGKQVAKTAGYKKLCLELGGNSELIVLDDADMEMAVELAAEGCYRNSGQRCTAVKRLLIHEKILDEFTEKFVAKTKEYICGDPADPKTKVGTVIDEEAAIYLERVYKQAVKEGAKLLYGGRREGALLEPTVIGNVPRYTEMVCEESFGPLAPIMSIRDVDDAIELANATAFGLSSGVVTNNLDSAIRLVKGIRTGTVNINAVPGYRIESSPFGGVKDSGLGIKEGVIESIKYMTNVKTFSLPW